MQRILVNIFSLTGSHFATKFLTVGVSLVLIRYLGAADYGEYTLILALTLLVNMIADLGLPTYLTREATRHPTKAEWHLRHTLGVKLVVAAGITPIYLALAICMRLSSAGRASMLINGVGLTLAMVGQVLVGVIQARERNFMLALNNAVYGVIVACTTLLAVWRDWGIVGVFWGNLLGTFISTGLLSFEVRYTAGLRLRPMFSMKVAWQVVRAAWPFGAASLFSMLYYRIDTLMIGYMLGNEALGHYAAAYKVTDAFFLLVGPIGMAFFPSLINYYETNMGQCRRFVSYLLRGMAAVAIPLSVGGAILSSGLMRMLFSREFHSDASLLAVLFGSLAVSYLLIVPRSLVNHTSPRVVYTVNGVAIPLNMVLNWFFLPHFGIMGAAVATLLCELFNLLIIGRSMSKALPGLFAQSSVAADFVRSLLAAGIMALALYPLRGHFLMVPIGVGALVYVVALVLTGFVKAEEWRAIVSIFKRRGRETVT